MGCFGNWREIKRHQKRLAAWEKELDLLRQQHAIVALTGHDLDKLLDRFNNVAKEMKRDHDMTMIKYAETLANVQKTYTRILEALEQGR